MEEKKMTERNFLELVSKGTLTDEVKAYAEEALAKKKNTLTPSQKENLVFKQRILDVLAGKDYTTAATIAELVKISPNKASALCRMLADSGNLIATEVKNEKKNKVKAYKIAE